MAVRLQSYPLLELCNRGLKIAFLGPPYTKVIVQISNLSTSAPELFVSRGYLSLAKSGTVAK